MKKIFFPVILIIFVILGFLIWKNTNKAASTKTACQVSQMVYYYTDTCTVCRKVKQEGTIEKIQALGVKVDKINANVGPLRHKFSYVPTFVIKDQIISGYKDFPQLKQLLGCPAQ